ncbi:hypothetical protein GQ55_5G534500 [Panicum hallii var. hallii]|uniref:Membrane-associated kinase regulator 2 n=1 Tax=Panicum hallii var. hallii TaxID=1504633 RepID=A0A2T7DT51_9POAL|nr:hypothetical protein GQ55_5G534500 [Panicum hallii var. hallii]
MESFSFLKYLRGGVVAGAQRAPVAATTIAASACEDGGGGGGGACGGGDVEDDASFFDLEFAVPGDESAASDAEEERVEFNFAVAGEDVASGGGEVVAVDAVAAPAGAETGDGKDGAEAEAAEAAPAPPPASLLRPATKFRVLLLKLRKPKVAVPAEGNGGAAAPKQTSRFLIKFRVDDAPLVSLFTRDNSSRTSDAGACADRPAAAAQHPQDASAAITAEERRFAKEVVLKYLSKIKPLYVKVSRRYGERLRFAGASEGEETDAEPDLPAPFPSPAPSSQPPAAAAASQPVVVACGVRAPRAGVPAGLKQVCKRLGKSRSASSAVAAAPSPPPPSPGAPQRRDDSLLQLQDGIQSAIAHCKRSFNASKGSESPLLRTVTAGEAPGGGRAADSSDGGDGA